MSAKKPLAAIAAAAELIDLIIDRAPRLRAAGVASLQLGDTAVNLVPHVDTGKAPAAEEHQEHPDPLQDPATFGRTAVPGYGARERDDDGEWADELAGGDA